jgi:hypothetical protein
MNSTKNTKGARLDLDKRGQARFNKDTISDGITFPLREFGLFGSFGEAHT